MGQQQTTDPNAPQPQQPETDDQLRARVPRNQGENDQAYLARLDEERLRAAQQRGQQTIDDANA